MVNFFVFLRVLFVDAICDLVHAVEGMYGLFKQHLEIFSEI